MIYDNTTLKIAETYKKPKLDAEILPNKGGVVIEQPIENSMVDRTSNILGKIIPNVQADALTQLKATGAEDYVNAVRNYLLNTSNSNSKE